MRSALNFISTRMEDQSTSISLGWWGVLTTPPMMLAMVSRLVIFYRNGKLPIWFALNGNAYGEAAGDTLDIWRLPYGGSVTIGVNKWHQVTVASVKEDGKVCRFTVFCNFQNII